MQKGSLQEMVSYAPKVGRDLHLLSIDGWGIRTITSLVILKEILHRLKQEQNLVEIPRPCDVFDLAGGTGTGGIVVVMLFRLGMSVDEAIKAYAKLSKDVFSNKTRWPHGNGLFKASLLEDAIMEIILSNLDIEKGGAAEMPMMNERGPKCFVSASTARDLSFPSLFRTYVPSQNPSYNCTILEAIRATTAEHPFFPSVDIGEANLKQRFIGGMRWANPVKFVLQEAESIFPNRNLSCIVSIGTGATGVIGFKNIWATDLNKVLRRVAIDCEAASEEMAKHFSHKDEYYCRLNVDHGLEGIRFEEWEKLGDVATHTVQYLKREDVCQKVDRLVQVLNGPSANLFAVKRTLGRLGVFLDGLPLLKRGWGLSISKFVLVIEFFQPSKKAVEALKSYCGLLQDSLTSCLQGKTFSQLPDDLQASVDRLLAGLMATFLNHHIEDDPISVVNANIQRLLQRFWTENHIAGNIFLNDILEQVREGDILIKKHFTRLERHALNENLRHLNVAPSAACNSYEMSQRPSCFQGTRVKLLGEIANWIANKDENQAKIYVLDGVAGIGKSVISKTVAERAAEINILGASFFFSRDEEKRKTAKSFFPAIAFQLALYDEMFADGIGAALERHPDVSSRSLQAQFSALIEPLIECFGVEGNPILILIDALDECEEGADVLLKILADEINKMPRLKVFITSRPEQHIRSVLDQYRHLERFHLHDIEASVVKSDIQLYLASHLSAQAVREALPILQLTWHPSKKDMEMLIGISGTLFITASTAVRFILDNKRCDPAKQLSRLLKGVSEQDFTGSKYTTVMDKFYLQILRCAVPLDSGDPDVDSETDDDWFHLYRLIVGSIVVLQDPLPCRPLAVLLGRSFNEIVGTLSHLHSLVAPTGKDLVFRIHHKSFPDFVTSPTRCPKEFLINPKEYHLWLSKQCLKTMNSCLKPNMCNLSSTDLFKNNNDLHHLTRNGISQEVTYACTHWATHLTSAGILDDEIKSLLELFASTHLLPWLEVLSIMERVDTAYMSLERISKIVARHSTMGFLDEVLKDGCRFVSINMELLKFSAMHIYAAFSFIPEDTALRRTYVGPRNKNLEMIRGCETTWDPTISVLTGHTGYIYTLAFSTDGSKLASASHDKTIRLWDGLTGSHIATLEGHSDSVWRVGFSPDGSRLASASTDQTVRLWDGRNGAQIAVLEGHSDSVWVAEFSQDGSKLASASEDKTIRLWDAQSGQKFAVLEGHSQGVHSIAFLANGSTLASGSVDGTVQLWDTRTGSRLAILRGHSKTVRSLAFSAHGSRLVSGSHDKTLRLWDSKTGSLVMVLKGHTASILSTTFSSDGSRFASASIDKTVRLWDGECGKCVAVLEGHSDHVWSVAFSTDASKLASASSDKTVRLWDAKIGRCVAILNGHSDHVWSVAFSGVGFRLASGSRDQMVRLWDGEIDNHTIILERHSQRVSFVTFSRDGSRVASASADNTVRLWDGYSGKHIALLEGHLHRVSSIAFSADGSKIASASSDKTVRVWDGQFGTHIAVLTGHTQRVVSVAFSEDGSTLASASDDKTVHLWDGQTNNCIALLKGHSDYISSVAFLADGSTIASASYDNTVRLWDARSGRHLRTLEILNEDLAISLAFVPDTSKLLSIYETGALCLVDCSTGDQLNIALEMTIKSAVVMLDSNCLVALVCRQQPSLHGLVVVKFENDRVLEFLPLCWFPPNLPVHRLSVSIDHSRVVIGCEDGRVLFLKIDSSLL